MHFEACLLYFTILKFQTFTFSSDGTVTFRWAELVIKFRFRDAQNLGRSLRGTDDTCNSLWQRYTPERMHMHTYRTPCVDRAGKRCIKSGSSPLSRGSPEHVRSTKSARAREAGSSRFCTYITRKESHGEKEKGPQGRGGGAPKLRDSEQK
jgi:hypothetical protein